MKRYVLLDVGGTQIKGCSCDESGNLMEDIRHYPAYAKEKKEVIFDNLASIINELSMGVGDSDILGVGMAFPGPFDYNNGISLMKNLDKYEDIYGIPIKEEMKKRIPDLKNTRFCFLHDVEAFGIGASCLGEAKEEDKVICLCIGTGIGSSFLKNQTPLKNKKDGVPQNGWIYNTPFQDSILDDYLSVRGLAALSNSIIGKEYSGNELFELCQSGNKKALDVYKKFGETMKLGLREYINEFEPNAIVFGGQIAKSFCYFGQALEEECSDRNIKIYLEQDSSLRAIQGLWITMRELERRRK